MPVYGSSDISGLLVEELSVGCEVDVVGWLVSVVVGDVTVVVDDEGGWVVVVLDVGTVVEVAGVDVVVVGGTLVVVVVAGIEVVVVVVFDGSSNIA